MERTFTEEDIQQFAKLTGDYGKLHTDAAFAAKYGFGRPVVHGILTGSLLSSIMGTTLPGAGTILMDENLTFTAPVYAGDTITASIKLVHMEEKALVHRRIQGNLQKIRWDTGRRRNHPSINDENLIYVL